MLEFLYHFNDPVLDTPMQEVSIANALLYRDRARTRIGQWNLNNLNTSAGIQPMIDTIAARGEKASASCGGMSFYLEKILQKNLYKAQMLSLYTIRNDRLYLHAANYVEIKGKGFLLDGHSGMVWQNKQGELASPLAFGCQTLCHGTKYWNWEYYPSSHGRQYRPLAATFLYALEYMNAALKIYQPARDPGLISAIAILKPNDDHLKTQFQTVYIFDNGRLSQKYLGQLYDLWHKINNLDTDTVIQYVDKNTCACEGTVTTPKSPGNFQAYALEEKKSANQDKEPKGPDELLRVN